MIGDIEREGSRLSSARLGKPPSEPLLVSVVDTARQLGIGLTTARALVKSGALASVRIGSRRLILVSDIEEFICTLASGEDAGAAPGGTK